jgi:hypothetical protein
MFAGRLDYESRATGLDRNELGALLVAAGLGSAAEHPLISMLALDGLRYRKPQVPISRRWSWNAATGH